jgi:hypothetical protein
VTIDHYRAAIGLHNNFASKHKFKSDLYFWSFVFPNFYFYNFVLPNILRMCNDIESNPGPIGDNVYKKYEIGHANARSLTAIIEDPLDTTQKICKFDLIKNHILFYEYDVFGISETWLDDTIDSADIKIDGYHDPIRRDYNRNQRGIMVYISKSCPARRRQDLEPVDGEVICVELQSKFRKT